MSILNRKFTFVSVFVMAALVAMVMMFSTNTYAGSSKCRTSASGDTMVASQQVWGSYDEYGVVRGQAWIGVCNPDRFGSISLGFSGVDFLNGDDDSLRIGDGMGISHCRPVRHWPSTQSNWIECKMDLSTAHYDSFNNKYYFSMNVEFLATDYLTMPPSGMSMASQFWSPDTGKVVRQAGVSGVPQMP